ncbi:hypothetical protein V5E97_33730 [Singulisphaera sp. Ch08]|uniref:Uncharacterized protein n=1 Tax=Singulisphaera sp. Ch08 TaxID=3120278 RepID=A0AAU7CDD4_9BACT
MRPRSFTILLLGFLPPLAMAAGSNQTRADEPPVLRLQAGGPTSYVTGLAFSPDGKSLYETGWDKVIRVWTEKPGSDQLALNDRATYRVPVGPGLDGAINAMALSSDGVWLAVAGRGIVPGASGFHQNGLVIPAPAKSDEMRWSEGSIFVFNTKANVPSVTVLRGHRGPVLSLAFAPMRADKPPLLVSAAHEMDRSGEVRLWDVAKAEYLTGLAGMPGPELYKTRPALTAWHTGTGRTQVRVAIAWWAGTFGKDPGILRCWDADRGQSVFSIADGAVNDTFALLPGRSQLLSGSFLVPSPNQRPTSPQGQLTTWRTDAGPMLQAVPERRISLASADPQLKPQAMFLPRAMAVVTAPADGSPRFAALILQDLAATAPDATYSLRLTDLSQEKYGATVAHVPLRTATSAKSAQPVLAVDPSGTRLALALGEEQEVTTFFITNLIAGKTEPRQRLRSAGLNVAYVGFAKRANQLGLVINTKGPERLGTPPRPLAVDDLVFDFSGRQLIGRHEGWAVSGPATNEGWIVDHSPAHSGPNKQAVPESLRIRKDQGVWQSIALQPGETTTALAFHPGVPGGGPIVAVASQTGAGEPHLRLYSGRSGAWIRQYTGHSERIGCLAFSEDGRLLASAADDRSTCVWSLADLGETIGKRGQIRGLAVTEQGNRLVVVKTDDSAGRNGPSLRQGDRVDGIVSGGELRPLRTVLDFYNAVSTLRPGQHVTVRRADGQTGPVDVSLPIVQGTDERKPLLSLFFTPGDAAGTWKWIGWNPQGPYETSDLEVESLIGWHFNTGVPASPTRFALAPEYHDKFYYDHILQKLIERGSLPPPEVPPLPPPNLSMAIDQEAEIVRGDQILVRQPPGELHLSIVDRPIPAELVDSVIGRVGSFPPTELRSTLDRVWTADVSGLAWKPGVYPVHITLKTKETPSQTFSIYRQIRFQRPAPTVKPTAPPALVVNVPEFIVRADVEPAHQTSVKVRITREPGGDSREQVLNASSTIAVPFPLEPGTNRFRLRAVNVEAVPGFEEEETTELPPLIVNYKKKALAPTVELVIRPSPVGDGEGEGESEGEGEVGQAGETVQVTVPQVTLRGTIKGEELLVEAVQVKSGTPTGRPLTRFVPGREKTFSINEPVKLIPGTQTFVVRARAADSDSGEGRVTVVYQPRLPRLVRRDLNPAGPVLYEHEDHPQVTVTARLAPPNDPHPLKGELLLYSGDEPQPRIILAKVETTASAPPGAKTNDANGMSLTALVPLTPGENHIRIRLSNEWGAEWTSSEDVVSFRRPPRVVEVKIAATTEKGSTSVSAQLESATEITEAQIEVWHEGQTAWVRANPTHTEGTHWSVSAADVPVEPGQSQVRVRARNLDGWNHEPGPSSTLSYTRRETQEPPLLDPPDTPLTTTLGEIPIPIAVRSAKPLHNTELRHLISESRWETIPAEPMESAGRDDKGRILYRGSTQARLNDGLNQFELVTSNPDGEARVKFFVSRVPPPIRFTVDGFQPEGDRSKLIEPTKPIPDGRVWIVGRVQWPDAEVQRRNAAARIQVLVNGFPQIETALLQADAPPIQGAKPGSDRIENRFRAGILLNRPENSVELKLSGVAVAADSLPLSVACLAPNQKQRLHMLVIGIGAQDKPALKKLAVQAVNGEFVSDRKDERVFKTPAFSSGRVYGPLSNEFTKMHVMAQISLICEQIRLKSNAASAPNGSEVVLIYYQGGEWIGENQTSLLIRRGRDKNSVDGVTIDELVRPFVNTRGAKLLLLDVATMGPLRNEEPWSRDVAHVGLMRFLWLAANNEERPAIPDDLRLLRLFKEVLPSTVTLGQATTEISGRYSRLHTKYPNRFIFENHPLPDPFSELLFGKP